MTMQGIQPATGQTARAFVKRIRNDRKRAYATAYLHYLTMEGTTEPQSDDYQPLSYMAMQAVRLELTTILEENGS